MALIDWEPSGRTRVIDETKVPKVDRRKVI
jgi:hypothetical protein